MNGEQEKILMLKKLILNTLKIKYNIIFIFFFFCLTSTFQKLFQRKWFLIKPSIIYYNGFKINYSVIF